MPQTIRCNDPRHPNCGKPIARLEDDGTLVIISRHFGEKHVGYVTKDERKKPAVR